MSEPADLVARLRLLRSANIGPVSYTQLVARFGCAEAALDAIPDLARRGGGRPARLASAAEIEREIDDVTALGARYLFRDDMAYPASLAQVDGAPPALIVKGEVTLLAMPAIAMVGARNASAAACRFARQLARDLGQAGTVVVSGLARGIDSAAHDGSIETGTVAVIAGGVDIVYPPENDERQRMISERGLLVAEQPPGTEPRARHFPWRNRIIAGLGAGTVVIEAAPKSGSLITARYAADYGREVMAIPGSPLDPRAQGCNQLIRDGATLVQNADDVLEALCPLHLGAPAPTPRLRAAQTPEPDDRLRHRVVDLLGPTPVPVDELVRQAEVGPAEAQLVLLELELAGRLARHAGGKVSLA